jgi:hypothetical protein
MSKGVGSVCGFLICFDFEFVVFLALGVVVGSFLSFSYHSMGIWFLLQGEQFTPCIVSTNGTCGGKFPRPARTYLPR